MKPKLQSRLFIVGNIGYDIYLVAPDEIYVRPAGSAYNIASGILALDGEATVVGKIGKCFNREFLKKFHASKVRVLANEVLEGPDSAFVFDLRTANARPELTAVFSECRGAKSPGLFLRESPFQDLHVHIGTMPLATMAQMFEECASVKRNASFSCNLYAPYLLENPELALGVISKCSLVFFNSDEFDLLSSRGYLGQVLADRIAVVTCGARGVVCFVDGIGVFSYTAKERPAVCTIGAGDVFAGAFMAALANSKRVSSAMVAAAEVAAISVQDYGVERTATVRAELGSFESWDDFIDGNMPLVASAGPRLITVEPSGVSVESVTATGVFVIRDGKLLLIRKPVGEALQPAGLEVPGGKLLAGQSPEHSARQSLREQTGLEGGKWSYVGAFRFGGGEGGDKRYLFHQFLTKDPCGSASPLSNVTDCSWLPVDAIEKDGLFQLTWAQVFLARAFGIF